MSILVIGSINTDLVTTTSRHPLPGETLTATSFAAGAGGKGANQAVACARLLNRSSFPKIKVHMQGAVGADVFGDELVTSLEEDKINVSLVQRKKEESTGTSTIIVDEKTGENRILFAPGANYSLLPQDLMSLPEPVPTLVVLQLEIRVETVLKVLEIAEERRVPVVLNPAPAVRLDPAVLRQVGHLICNETEAVILNGGNGGDGDAGELGPEVLAGIAKGFNEVGVEVVVITLGARGAFVRSRGGEEIWVPAAKVERVVDTTAAGDTFVGAYAGELAKWLTEGKRGDFGLERAVQWACRCAARTVEKKGAQDAIPRRWELDTEE